MLRLVLDTNILISALLRKNTPPYLLYQAWRGGRFNLVTSDKQLKELQRVMAYPKLQRYFTSEEARKMLVRVTTYAICITSLSRGIDVTTSPEEGLIGVSDERQLAYALSQQRVIMINKAHYTLVNTPYKISDRLF